MDELKEKKCSKCEFKLPVSAFSKNRNESSGFHAHCRDCRSKCRKAAEAKRKARENGQEPSKEVKVKDERKKKCTKCEKKKSFSDFPKNKSKPGGIESRCTECAVKHVKQWRIKKFPHLAERARNPPPKKDPTKKHCPTCKEIKPLYEFHNASGRGRGKYPICKSCCAIREYIWDVERSKVINEWKSNNPCPCGQTDPELIESSHITRENKRFKVWSAKSRKALDEELVKCIGECYKCHLRRTVAEAPRTTTMAPIVQLRTKIINDIRAARGKCMDCELPFDPSFPIYFEFDHRPDEIKLGCVSAMVTWSNGENLIPIEAKKCDMVCKGCHRKRTKFRLQENWFIAWEFGALSKTMTLDAAKAEVAKKYGRRAEDIEDIFDKKNERFRVMSAVHGKDWIKYVPWNIKLSYEK
jgi:hypothetical protein